MSIRDSQRSIVYKYGMSLERHFRDYLYKKPIDQSLESYCKETITQCMKLYGISKYPKIHSAELYSAGGNYNIEKNRITISTIECHWYQINTAIHESAHAIQWQVFFKESAVLMNEPWHGKLFVNIFLDLLENIMEMSRKEIKDSIVNFYIKNGKFIHKHTNKKFQELKELALNCGRQHV